MDRRSLLGSMLAIVTAGCSALESQPDPTVLDTETSRSITEIIGGEADFFAEIVNDGGDGQIEVTLSLLDRSEQTLSRTRERYYFNENQRKEVTISSTIPDGTYKYEISAVPV